MAPGGIERREVTIGDNNDKYVEVKSGLADGEQVTLDARARVTAEAKAAGEKAPVSAPKPASPTKTPPPPPAAASAARRG
jgi:hypothetical protein